MMTITEGMRIQFPNWDESQGPTLVVVRVDEDAAGNGHVTTRSDVTGAVVVRPLATVLARAKAVSAEEVQS